MDEVVGKRLQAFNTPGSLGVVKDTRYIRCFWPLNDLPFNPFAEGSEGIEVQGPPTPRNILFPPGTRFLNGTRGDCLFEVTRPTEAVIRSVEVKETVSVRGKDVEATFREPQEVQEVVRRVREISQEEAENGKRLG
jgi:hypothetical protein